MAKGGANRTRRWAVAIMTAPRPVPTLSRCLGSIGAAGWPDTLICIDAQGAGPWPAFLKALAGVWASDRTAEWIMIAQDDAVFCAGA